MNRICPLVSKACNHLQVSAEVHQAEDAVRTVELWGALASPVPWNCWQNFCLRHSFDQQFCYIPYCIYSRKIFGNFEKQDSLKFPLCFRFSFISNNIVEVTRLHFVGFSCVFFALKFKALLTTYIVFSSVLSRGKIFKNALNKFLIYLRITSQGQSNQFWLGHGWNSTSHVTMRYRA